MIAIWIFLVSIFLLSCATKPPRDEASVIYVLGSIHGNMLDQPKNNLRDFIAALHQFKPSLILTEARPDFPSAVEATIDGGPEQSFVYAFAKESGAKVVPVDWHNDQYNIESAKANSKMTQIIKKEIEPLLGRFLNIVQTGSFLESQSPETQNLIRKRYDILASHGISFLRKRDSNICQNIKKLSLSNERVLIVFGLAHKYYLEDCVQEKELRPVAAEGWFDQSSARKFTPSQGLNEEAIRTLKAAKYLLGSRLKDAYYKTDVENLKEKLAEFDVWIQKASELNNLQM
jgi:hypothetical protein